MWSRRRALLTIALLVTACGAGTARGTPADVFFSEYIEGSSNNKALEIYNGTGATVDLVAGDYTVQMYFNGSTSAGLTIPLTGTALADGDVYVVSAALGECGDPGPGRPDERPPGGSTATTPSCCARAA